LRGKNLGVNIPHNFEKFLDVDKNKKELFNLLANDLIAVRSPVKQVFCTYKDKVISSSDEETIASISLSSHDEADARTSTFACI